MYTYSPPRSRKAKKRSKKPLLICVCVVLALLAPGVWWWAGRDSKPRTNDNPNSSTPQSGQNETAKLPLVDLQPTVDVWVARKTADNNSDFSYVVYDPANKQVIASRNPDKKYFAASLYKIFVAYLALVDFQNGAQDPGEILTGGFTKKECVDKMIRESHSPCGEAMMADMGQEKLRQRISEMGIKNTIFAGITTTAQDCALILQYIVEGRDLNSENTAFLKDAMRVQDQKFRNGLAKGAPEATWETKVGWNEQANYHDIGIMTLPSGRQYIVAILSQGQGKATPIADFAATIYSVLK